MKRALPTDSAERKNYPLFRGFLRYFPAAIAGAARISKLGNDKHNPGQEMHHARGKSNDHGDCIMRHLHDTDEQEAAMNRMHTTEVGGAVWKEYRDKLLDEVDQLFWRAGALSQELHEKYGEAPLAPGAKVATPVMTATEHLIRGYAQSFDPKKQVPDAGPIENGDQFC